MKIAFVIHDLHLNGGQERSTLEIVNRLSRNHEVHVYATSISGIAPGVVAHPVSVRLRRPLVAKDLEFRRNIRTLLKGHNYDLIHATGSCTELADIYTIQFCQRAWKDVRKSGAQSFNWRSIYHDLQFQFDLQMEKRVIDRTRDKLYISISKQIENDLKRFYEIQNVITITHGVDTSKFCPNSKARIKKRSEWRAAENEKLILFAGAFERKGLFFLLPAIAELKKRIPVRLVVMGSGPVDKLIRESKKIGIDPLILGSVTKPEEIYPACDLFVLPSLYDPFGLVGLEALACGLPSAISVQSGVSQFITKENGSLIARPWDTKNILESMLDILENPLGLSAMSTHARQTAVNCDWDQIYEKYEELFKTNARRTKIPA